MKNKGSGEVRLLQLNLVNIARGTVRKRCREILNSFKKQIIYFINLSQEVFKVSKVFITCFFAAKFSTAILDARMTNCTTPTMPLLIPNAFASSRIALFLSS
jgi:hypothetical protein